MAEPNSAMITDLDAVATTEDAEVQEEIENLVAQTQQKDDKPSEASDTETEEETTATKWTPSNLLICLRFVEKWVMKHINDNKEIFESTLQKELEEEAAKSGSLRGVSTELCCAIFSKLVKHYQPPPQVNVIRVIPPEVLQNVTKLMLEQWLDLVSKRPPSNEEEDDSNSVYGMYFDRIFSILSGATTETTDVLPDTPAFPPVSTDKVDGEIKDLDVGAFLWAINKMHPGFIVPDFIKKLVFSTEVLYKIFQEIFSHLQELAPVQDPFTLIPPQEFKILRAAYQESMLNKLVKMLFSGDDSNPPDEGSSSTEPQEGAKTTPEQGCSREPLSPTSVVGSKRMLSPDRDSSPTDAKKFKSDDSTKSAEIGFIPPGISEEPKKCEETPCNTNRPLEQPEDQHDGSDTDAVEKEELGNETPSSESYSDDSTTSNTDSYYDIDSSYPIMSPGSEGSSDKE